MPITQFVVEGQAGTGLDHGGHDRKTCAAVDRHLLCKLVVRYLCVAARARYPCKNSALEDNLVDTLHKKKTVQRETMQRNLNQ